MTKRLKLPVHYLYYEDYGKNYSKTMNDLLDFLGQPFVKKPLPFVSGKTYRHMFDDRTIQVAARFVQEFASPDCWDKLKEYFVE